MHSSARQHQVQTSRISSKMKPWRCQTHKESLVDKIKVSLNILKKKRNCLKKRRSLKDWTRVNGHRGSFNKFSNQSKSLALTWTKCQQLQICRIWWTLRSISGRIRCIWKMLSKSTFCLVPYSFRPRETLRRSSCWETECRHPICYRLRQILPNFWVRMIQQEIEESLASLDLSWPMNRIRYWAMMTDKTWKFKSKSCILEQPSSSSCALNQCASGHSWTTSCNLLCEWPHSAVVNSSSQCPLETRYSWQMMSIPRWSRFCPSC